MAVNLSRKMIEALGIVAGAGEAAVSNATSRATHTIADATYKALEARGLVTAGHDRGLPWVRTARLTDEGRAELADRRAAADA